VLCSSEVMPAFRLPVLMVFIYTVLEDKYIIALPFRADVYSAPIRLGQK